MCVFFLEEIQIKIMNLIEEKESKMIENRLTQGKKRTKILYFQ